MKLLIDSGNTRIKWAVVMGDVLQNSTAANWQDDGINRLEQDCLTLQRSIKKVFLAHVGTALQRDSLMALFERIFSTQATQLQSEPQFGNLTNGYKNHQELGVDRWLAVVAAHHLVKQETCFVVDCGSALTIDVLAQGGRHLGGYILPGMRLMGVSLVNNTAHLPRVPKAKQGLSLLPAQDTEQAIATGIVLAMAGAIESAVVQCMADLAEREPYPVLLTGGDASCLIKHLTGNVQYVPDLVLQGMVLVCQSVDSG